MLELEPPVHTRLRTLVNRAFVSRQVERLRPRVEALANELIDRFEPGQPSICCRPSRRRCRSPSLPKCSACRSRWGRNCSTGRTGWSPCTCMAARARPRRRPIAPRGDFSDFLRGYVTERRKNPGDDLLSLLISAQEDGQKLSEDETGVLGHPAAQCRPRGDRPPDRQCRALDPGARRRSAPLLHLAGSDRGNRRGMPALRCAAAHVHALRLSGDRGRPRHRRAAGRDDRTAARHGQSRPARLRRAPRLPARTVRTRRTCRSAPASISASARRSPGSNCRCR